MSKSVTCPVCKTSLSYLPDDTVITCGRCNRNFRIQRSNSMLGRRTSSSSSVPRDNQEPFDASKYPADIRESLTMMHTGHQFTMISAARDGTFQMTEVFVFLAPAPPSADVKTSSLYWSSVGSRSMSSSRCLSLKDIKEMLQGLPKNIEQQLSGTVVKNQCFVLYSRTQSLTLEADSKQRCRDWLTSIHKVLMTEQSSSQNGSGTPSQKPALDRPETVARSFAEDPVDPRVAETGLKPKTLSPDELEATIAMMSNSTNFKRYVFDSNDNSTRLYSVALFYDPKTETIYWCKPGSKIKSPNCSLPLRSVSDIYVGKRDRSFQSKLAANASHERCFTLKTSRTVLNLEALEDKDAIGWLSGIHCILSKKKQSSLPSFEMDPSLRKIVKLMQAGNNFKMYTDEGGGRVTVHKVFVFHNMGSDTKGLGKLCWCSPGQKTITPGCSFGLDQIKEMTIGKHTQALQSRAAANADQHRCFSIIGTNGSLSLEAESRGKLALWLNGVHRLLTTVKSRKMQKNAKQDEVEAELDLEAVHSFTRYLADGKVEKVQIMYQPGQGRLGALFWCPGGVPFQTQSDRCMPLHTISELCLGRQDAAFLRPPGDKADPACCFSLFSKLFTLNLEAPDANTRTQWLNEIHKILTQSGGMKSHRVTKPPTPSTPSPALPRAPPPLPASPAQPPSPAPSNTVTKAVLLLSNGANFYQYQDAKTPGGSPVVTPILLFYKEARGGGLGSLYWCDPKMGRQETAGNSLALSQIREMTAGKQTPVFESRIGRKADDNRCFSLRTPDTCLNLEAFGVDECSAWLSALHRILTESGKKAEANTPALPAGSTRQLPGSSINVDDEDPSEIFDVIAKIGQGSYGSVYKATDKRDGKVVGLKLLDFDADSLQDIAKEIKILQDCTSEYIVGLKGVFSKNKTIWIAMEFCAAGSLSDMMQICRQTLTEAQIACVMKMSLQGLKYLHSRKIIHRDVKAANILVTDGGECKLADFGVSSDIVTTLSRKQTVIGTPNWMAPEVIKASAYNDRADIWSLGITAIELADGQPPHSDVHPMTAMFNIPTAPPPTLPNPEKWSKNFKAFIHVCLHKDPNRRPTAAQLLEKHPFIVNAGHTEVIMEFVDQCMLEMSSYRDMNDSAGQMTNATMTYSNI